MSKIQMVDLQGQYSKIKPAIDKAVGAVIDSCQFINGSAVKSFSKNLATYLDVKHCIPCANGTDALQIALMALGLKPGDEVITTPFTFVATVEVIALLQLKPIFVDVHADTFNIDEKQLEAAITERTKCIIPVHLFGQAANMEAIMAISSKYGIPVVEDNAQAIGGEYFYNNGSKKKLGTIGSIGCTSFFPSKNLGCYGDGGALFTNDDDLADKIMMITNHGSRVRYYHESIGVNSRLDSIQAAVLDVKLRNLDLYNQSRQEAAVYYTEQLGSIKGIQTPKIASYSSHVFHQYTLIIKDNRDKVLKHLQSKGIACGVYYPVPLHLQAAYQDGVWHKGDFPVTEYLSNCVLSLPMHTELTKSIMDEVISSVVEGMGV